MKAVVYSEVAQMIIKVLGIIIIGIYGLINIGGWSVFTSHLDTTRLQVVDVSNLGVSGDEYGFLPMLLGGIFLYTSYYGTDQMQAQRILSAKDMPTLRNTLLYRGLFRFPITLLYCLGGLIIGTFVKLNADFASKIPVDKTDLMIPVFIENYLPHGIIGIIVVAIIAAAMSAYSSIINSLSAVTMEEFVQRRHHLNDEKYVFYSKVVALIWGVVTMIVAFNVGNVAKTVIEAINKVNSIFYGPILGVFLLAILTKSTHARATNLGLVLGVSLNIYLWLGQPQIFWFWWNVIGCSVTFLIAYFGSKIIPPSVSAENTMLAAEKPNFKIPEIRILIIYFIVIVLFSILLPYLLG